MFTSFYFFDGFSQGDQEANFQDYSDEKKFEIARDSLNTIIKKREFAKGYKYVDAFIDLGLLLGEYEEVTKKLTYMPVIFVSAKKNKDALYTLLDKVENSYSIEKKKDGKISKIIKVIKAKYLWRTRGYKEAVDLLNQSIDSIQEMRDLYLEGIYMRGANYIEIGRFAEAFSDFKLVSELYKKEGNKKLYYYSREYLVDIYYKIGLYEKSALEREKIIDDRLKDGFTTRLSSEYIALALSYEKLGDIKKQEKYINLALQHIKNEDESSKKWIYSSLVPIKFNLGKDKEAEDYFKKFSDLYATDKERQSDFSYKFTKIDYLINKKKNGKVLEELLQNVYKISKENNDTFELREITKKLAEYYESKNNFKKSNFYLKEHYSLQDLVANEIKSSTLLFYQTLYESERKESEILKQQEEIRTLEDEAKTRTLMMTVGGGGLTLLFVILFLLRNQKFLKRKNDLKAKFSQHLLLSRDNERKRISKDLHDSLGQKLLLIKHKVSRDDTEIKNLLNDSIEEMRSISRRLNPMQLKEERITSIISNLIEELDMAYPEIYIFAEIDDINDLLTTQQELNLYRIIQESFSNIIKHAKASSAKLEIKRQNKSILVTIQDNGVGFEFSKKVNGSKSMGLKTIKERVHFLKGHLNVVSNKGEGTILKIGI